MYKKYVIPSLLPTPFVALLGYYLGSKATFDSFKTSHLADIGSFLAGTTGIILSITAIMGFNAWKRTLRATVISERTFGVEKVLEDLIVKAFQSIHSEKKLAAHWHKFGEKETELCTAESIQRLTLKNADEDNYAAFDSCLTKFRVALESLHYLTGSNNAEKSFKALQNDIKEVRGAIISAVYSETRVCDLRGKEREMLEKHKLALYQHLPFNND